MDLPRFALLDGPSPLQQIPRFASIIGGGADVWIKLEDLLPLAFGAYELRVEEMDGLRVAKLKLTRLLDDDEAAKSGGTEFIRR